MKTLCLNMIVKNESKIIKRCLESIKEIIDYYVIEDTGSTDGTQKIIKDFFDKLNIKGEIHNTKWVNFGTNRTNALIKARGKADYILLIDADMTIVIADEKFKEKLEKDMYSIVQQSAGIEYANVRIIKGDLDSKYVGVTHEYIDCGKTEYTHEKLVTMYMPDYTDGSNRVDKFKRDIQLLTDGLRDKNLPMNLRQRYSFYLAQSYRDLGKHDKSIMCYKKRLMLGGWQEELFYCLYQIGIIYLMANENQKGIEALMSAYELRPTRMEPLYELIKYFRTHKQYNMAKIFAVKAMRGKIPDEDVLFINTNVYNFLIQHEVTKISHYTGDNGDNEIGRIISEGLIHSNGVSLEVSTDVLNDMFFYSKPLLEYCKSFQKSRLYVDTTDDKHYILNPSIIYHDGAYIINTREVNYYLDIEKRSYSCKDTSDTNNKISYLNYLPFNLNEPIKHQILYDVSGIKTYPHIITGYEDLRLIMFNDQLYAVCTSIKTNEIFQNEMCLLKIENYKITKVLRLKCDKLEVRTEKNWTPVVHENKLLLYYTFQPAIILECNVENGICTVYSSGINSLNFTTYRGGSQIVKVNDKYVCVIHQVGTHDKRGYYYHRFVQFDDKLRVIKVSPLFTFSDRPTVEFCAGMCYDGKQLILTYGVEDQKAYIATVDPEEVFSLSI